MGGGGALGMNGITQGENAEWEMNINGVGEGAWAKETKKERRDTKDKWEDVGHRSQGRKDSRRREINRSSAGSTGFGQSPGPWDHPNLFHSGCQQRTLPRTAVFHYLHFNVTEEQKLFIHLEAQQRILPAQAVVLQGTPRRVIWSLLRAKTHLWGRSICNRPRILKKLPTLRTIPPEPQCPPSIKWSKVVKIKWENFRDENILYCGWHLGVTQ